MLPQTRGREHVTAPDCHLVTVAKRGVDIFIIKKSEDIFIIKKSDDVAAAAVDIVKVAGWNAWNAEWSPCVGIENGVLLVNPLDSFSKLYTIESGIPQRFYFSPKGNFAAILTGFIPESNERNFKVWDVKTNELKWSFTLKGAAAQEERWPPIHWTSEETFCFRLMPTELQVFKGALDDELIPSARFPVEKAATTTTLSISVEKSDGSVSCAIYTPPKGGTPATVLVLIAKSPTDELVVATMEIDSTGKSYYGTGALYYIQAVKNGLSCQLIGPDKGPIWDCAWSPSANEFVVISGPMPPTIKMYDGRNGEPKLSFGESPRNTIRFNPFGRFICLAGFGNLAGDVDVWDKNKKKIIGNLKARCTVECNWSPDGRMLLSATTTPRMRVDNGIKLFLYNGDLLASIDIPDLYSVKWRPAEAGVYPDRAPSRSRQITSAPVVSNIYRPPGAPERRVNVTQQTTAEVIAKNKSTLPPGAEFIESKSKSAKRNAAKRKKAREEKESTADPK